MPQKQSRRGVKSSQDKVRKFLFRFNKEKRKC